MRIKHSARLLICAALAGSASLAAVVVPGGIASATPLTVTCTHYSGSSASQAISGCTGTGAIAADAGVAPAHGTSVVSTKTITWSNGKTMKEQYSYVLHTGAANTCPVVALKTKVDLVTETGSVIAGGTATGMVGGALSGTICVYKLTAAPHTISINNKPGTVVKV